jgi:hypothetical protein
MSERHYILKGVIRGRHGMTGVPFSTNSDPWDAADTVETPDGFMTCKLVEKVGRKEVEVPLSTEAFRRAFNEIVGRILPSEPTT